MRERLIIVGKNGFLAGHLTQAAETAGWAVTGTSSRPTPGVMHMDLSAAADFDYGRIGREDVIVMAAAVSAPDQCQQDFDRVYAINVTGTAEFIQSCLVRGARVIFCSSDTVLGECEREVDEHAQPHPHGEYARMKREVERRFEEHGRFKALRLSYLFARGDRFTQYLQHCALSGEPARIFHPMLRRVVYVNDVVEAILALARDWNTVPFDVIHCGGPSLISRLNLAQCFQDVVAPSLHMEIGDAPPDFFQARPRVIDMVSAYFAQLIGHAPTSIGRAMRAEFPEYERGRIRAEVQGPAHV